MYTTFFVKGKRGPESADTVIGGQNPPHLGILEEPGRDRPSRVRRGRTAGYHGLARTGGRIRGRRRGGAASLVTSVSSRSNPLPPAKQPGKEGASFYHRAGSGASPPGVPDGGRGRRARNPPSPWPQTATAGSGGGARLLCRGPVRGRGRKEGPCNERAGPKVRTKGAGGLSPARPPARSPQGSPPCGAPFSRGSGTRGSAG